MNRFLAQAKEAGVAVNVLGHEAEVAGRKMQAAGNRGFWMSQAMFTLRRTLYHATLGVGLLGGAALVMGFQFNQSMEAATLAFTRFLGSPEAARKELDYLYDLARLTPFEFPQLLDATRKFLAFGFSIEESNSLLTDLGDAVSSFGGGADEINRATIALGQMRSSGRILGQDLRQLQQLGLFDPADFRKRLNLPQDYLKSVGDQNISSKRGIDAITAYWRLKFGGAAKDFSTTMVGRLTTVRDDLRKAFGLMFLPLYNSLRDKILPAVDSVAFAMQRGFEAGGFHQMFVEIDKLNGGGGGLARMWDHLVMVGTPLLLVVGDIADIFKIAWETVKPLAAVFIVLVPLLWGLHGVLSALKWPLGILLGLFLVERTVLGLIILSTKSLIIWRAVLWLWTRNAAIASSLYYYWTNRVIIAQLFALKATKLYAIAMAIFQISTWGAVGSLVALTIAFFASPAGWVTLGIIVLAGAFVILYLKVKWFRDMINDLWSLMKRMWKWVDSNPITKWGKFLTPLGPVFAALEIGKAAGGVDGAKDAFSGAKKMALGPSMTGFGTGMPAIAGMPNQGKPGVRASVPVEVKLDSRVLAEAMAEVELRTQGRG